MNEASEIESRQREDGRAACAGLGGSPARWVCAIGDASPDSRFSIISSRHLLDPEGVSYLPPPPSLCELPL